MRFAEDFLVRIATLPMDEVVAMVPSPPAAVLGELAAVESWLDERREALCDEIYRAVSGLGHREERRALLALKRAVYNGRGWDEETMARARPALEEPLAVALDAWREGVETTGRLRSEGEVAVEEHCRRRIRELRRRWGSDLFLTGLLSASPPLFKAVDRLLRGGGEGTDRRQCRAEATAVAYHFRMATKTSPFGTFTAVGAGRLDGVRDGWDEDGDLRLDVGCELNALVAERLRAAAANNPRHVRHHPVRLNPTLARDDSRYLFLARERAPERMRLASVEEKFVEVARTPALDRLVERVDCAPEGASPDDLLAELSASWGAPEEVATFLDRVVQTGLLLLDPAAELTDTLETSGGGVARGEDAADAADGGRCDDGLGGALERMATGAPGDKAAALEEVATTCDRRGREAGGPGVPEDRQGLVFLFSLLPRELRLRRDALQEIEADLAELDRLMVVFNAGHSMRRLLRRFHRSQGGGAVPLTRFLRDFYETAYRPLFGEDEPMAWEPFEAGVPPGLLPEVEELAARRAAFVRTCSTLLAAGDGPVELPEELVAGTGLAATDHWPRDLERSTAFLGHLLAEGEGRAFVLNQVLQGYGTYSARYCDGRTYGGTGRSLADRLRRRLRAVRCGEAELTEIVAVLGFNGQIHQPLTRRALVYPGERAPAAGYLPLRWRDLVVEHHERLDGPVLRDTAEGGVHLPVLLGPLAPHLLPVTCRVLLGLGPSFFPDFTLLDLLEHGREREGASEVRHYPRVCYRSVVLQRAAWRIPPALAPSAAAGRNGFTRFRELSRWAEELGLPRRVFVTPMRLPDLLAGGRARGRLRRLYKPFFVDFDDPLCTRLFDRYCDDVDSTLTVTELLPAPGDLRFRRRGRGHVTELLLELWGGG